MDGVDLCPASLKAQKRVFRGCSIADVVVDPARVLDWAKAEVDDARKDVRNVRALRQRAAPDMRRLARGLTGLRKAARSALENPCKADKGAAAAMRQARAGLAGLKNDVRLQQRVVVQEGTRRLKRAPKTGGDSDALDMRFHDLAAAGDQGTDALKRLERIRGLLKEACRTAAPRRRYSGRITKVDGSTATLDGGVEVVLSGASSMGSIATGRLTTFYGRKVAGGQVVASSGRPTAQQAPPDVTRPAECAFVPLVAPVQDFTVGSAVISYDPFDGFLAGGDVRLEGGMGINARRTGLCGAGADTKRVVVYLGYTSTSGQVFAKRFLGAFQGLPEYQDPALIPQDIDPSATGRFFFETQDGPTTTKVEEWRGRLGPTGHWAEAVYDRTRFAVPDAGAMANRFGVATLVELEGTLKYSAEIFGVGYGVIGGASTYPNRQFIVAGQQFAVHGGTPMPEDPGGLAWAYAYGFTGGSVFHYVARQPTVVTDMITDCPPGTPDSFYRLPWKSGTIHKVTQGNSTSFTHRTGGSQQFAFDFVMPALTVGRATRSGEVIYVDELRSKNKDPGDDSVPWIPGNTVKIRHQDGTVGYYTHMVRGGVFPEEGDVVARGANLTITGNTGNSSGPHLHHHVYDPATGDSVQMSFEVGVVADISAPCVGLVDDATYLSTNG